MSMHKALGEPVEKSSNPEGDLFPENPRRRSPSKDDDRISDILGDFSTVILHLAEKQITGICELAANRLMSPQCFPNPPSKSQQPIPKQVNRSSTVMGPPKTPPLGSSHLPYVKQPPVATDMPNGRHSSSTRSNATASLTEKTYLGPSIAAAVAAPSSSSGTHNDNLLQPKERFKTLSTQNDTKEILKDVTNKLPSPAALSQVDATPHITLKENYNLNEKNKHKYSIAILSDTRIGEPLDSLLSGTSSESAANISSTSISTNKDPVINTPANNASTISSTGQSSTLLSNTQVDTTPHFTLKENYNLNEKKKHEYSIEILSDTRIGEPLDSLLSGTSSQSASNISSSSISTNKDPVINTSANNASTYSSTGQSSTLLSNTAIKSPTVQHYPIMSSYQTVKQMEKPTHPQLENKRSVLEDDLELSESDDDSYSQEQVEVAAAAATSSSSAIHNGCVLQSSFPMSNQNDSAKKILNHTIGKFSQQKRKSIVTTPDITEENYNLNDNNEQKYSLEILDNSSEVEPLDYPPLGKNNSTMKKGLRISESDSSDSDSNDCLYLDSRKRSYSTSSYSSSSGSSEASSQSSKRDAIIHQSVVQKEVLASEENFKSDSKAECSSGLGSSAPRTGVSSSSSSFNKSLSPPEKAVAMTQISPLPSSPPQPSVLSHTQNPPKKLNQTEKSLFGSNNDEQNDLTKPRLVSPVAASGSAAEGPSASRGAIAVPKRGRGRPRKITLNQNGSVSLASASAKGQTLTAKRNTNQKPASTKRAKKPITTAKKNAKRKPASTNVASRKALATNTLPTPIYAVAPVATQQLLQAPDSPPEAMATVLTPKPLAAASDDSSSSSEFISSSPSSSSTSSDTEIEDVVTLRSPLENLSTTHPNTPTPQPITSLICKIDLSRLSHIPALNNIAYGQQHNHHAKSTPMDVDGDSTHKDQLHLPGPPNGYISDATRAQGYNSASVSAGFSPNESKYKRKRSSSSSSSEEKRPKKDGDDNKNSVNNVSNTDSPVHFPTTAKVGLLPTPPPLSSPPPCTKPQVIYRSYFESENALSDEFRSVVESFMKYSNSSTYSPNKEKTSKTFVPAKYQKFLSNNDAKFLQEAVQRKHAAEGERDTLNQVILYLEAVIYFLLSGVVMEQHSEDAAWKLYNDTLSLNKIISTKLKHLKASSAIHNKLDILSLRCQSLISFKLYHLKIYFCQQINIICTDFLKSQASNSIEIAGDSGSNTPPGKVVPHDVHSALYEQNQYFSYLASSHELWNVADRLVKQRNDTDFFVALDRQNGSLTLHSSVYEVFRYILTGLKKIKDEMIMQ